MLAKSVVYCVVTLIGLLFLPLATCQRGASEVSDLPSEDALSSSPLHSTGSNATRSSQEQSSDALLVGSILGGLTPVVVLICLAILSAWRRSRPQPVVREPACMDSPDVVSDAASHVALSLPIPVSTPHKMHVKEPDCLSVAAQTASDASIADTAWDSGLVNPSLQHKLARSGLVESAALPSPHNDKALEFSDTRTLAGSPRAPPTPVCFSGLRRSAVPGSENISIENALASRLPCSVASTLTYLTATVISLDSIPNDAAAVDVLQMQLDYVHAHGLEFYCLKLEDKSERRVGGQGIVQFASHAVYPKRRYAVKFYLDRQAFETEVAHLRNPRLQHILPSIEDVASNNNNLICILGRPLPPLVVIERGESLDEWQRRRQVDFASAMHIIMHIFERATDMHDADIVHRDLKPGNVIFYFARNEWTLIDFGGAAEKGASVPLTCTISYAAPEVVLALTRGERTHVAEPAVDVWALGVMAWELLTRSRVFPPASRLLVEETMAGKQPLPWERPGDPDCSRNLQRLGFMADGIMRMLVRDPTRRATLREVLSDWHHFLKRDPSLDAVCTE